MPTRPTAAANVWAGNTANRVEIPAGSLFAGRLVADRSTVTAGMPIVSARYAGYGIVAEIDAASAYKITDALANVRVQIQNGPGPFACSPMGTIATGTVNALTVHNNQLYAAGVFFIGNSCCIARWNGSDWTSVGNGLNNTVNALASFEGSLYAAGLFTTAGGQPANLVARLDSGFNQWRPLGSGIDGYVASQRRVDSLAVGGEAERRLDTAASDAETSISESPNERARSSECRSAAAISAPFR